MVSMMVLKSTVHTATRLNQATLVTTILTVMRLMTVKKIPISMVLSMRVKLTRLEWKIPEMKITTAFKIGKKTFPALLGISQIQTLEELMMVMSETFHMEPTPAIH